jgi:hypothetical protein
MERDAVRSFFGEMGVYFQTTEATITLARYTMTATAHFLCLYLYIVGVILIVGIMVRSIFVPLSTS